MYFCGQSKRWILSVEDIQAMYYNPSRDSLWCDGRDDDDNTVIEKWKKHIQGQIEKRKEKWNN